MTMPTLMIRTIAAALVLGLAGCAIEPVPKDAAPADWRVSAHRAGDDLLTAGLGLAGLRSPIPPPFAQPAQPTTEELRRRAIWSNWRGIADTAAGGGLGDVYGDLDAVPGREFHAFRRLPGATHPHRVLLQLPDAFDRDTRCLVVTAASGSRGVYGAIALAGGWGLPRGCAVVHTDKGAGSGWFDTAGGRGARLDGRTGERGVDTLEFAPDVDDDTASPRVLFKHAHSADHPEADWGRHVEQAARFAIDVLNAERDRDEPPYTLASMTVLAAGLSNGGGAVLRAAEIDGDWLDGVVAISPNIHVDGARPLYDITTDAALWMPCAMSAAAFDSEALARPGGRVPPAWTARCASLHRDGRLRSTDAAAQADEALRHLHGNGWTDPALAAATLSVGFDLWRAVSAAYAASYLRSGTAAMPCGYAYAMLDADGQPRAPTAAEQAAWWSDSSGITPGSGVQLVEPERKPAADADPAWAGLRCLRALWDGDDNDARTLRAAIAETRAAPPRDGLPVLVMHGIDDGLVPEAHSSVPYVAAVRAAARPVRHWRIGHAQHFDAFLGLPPLAARYVPLLPYAWRGMDAMWAHVRDGAALPADAMLQPRQRGADSGSPRPLTPGMLQLP